MYGLVKNQSITPMLLFLFTFKGPCMVWLPMYARGPSLLEIIGGGVTPYSEIILRGEPPTYYILPGPMIGFPPFLFNKGGHTPL